jgi:hypothetical protein
MHTLTAGAAWRHVGRNRVFREVTLVVTDVEGSTELWEWDYSTMTLAQEIHDSVMRSLIARCVHTCWCYTSDYIKHCAIRPHKVTRYAITKYRKTLTILLYQTAS